MGWFQRHVQTERMLETADAMGRGAEATRGSPAGVFTAMASAVALLFSAYSVYETSLRRPDLQVFVPGVMHYASPYQNSTFEVFNLPVSVANLGARSGTVLAMDLSVTNLKRNETKRFYAADTGRWTLEAARAFAFQPFAPVTLAGKSSASQTVLFYPRQDETIQQITDQAGGSYRFTLTVHTANPDSLWPLDGLWTRVPAPQVFTMTMGEIDHRTFQVATQPLYAQTPPGAPPAP